MHVKNKIKNILEDEGIGVRGRKIDCMFVGDIFFLGKEGHDTQQFQN